ncbi:MAG TPA: AAA family ATPase [Kribbella sp.]|nr:AAA family ATPase [Kribbella sp.]
MTRLIVVCGMPGAGKTTIALRLARASPALRMCPDELALYDDPASI